MSTQRPATVEIAGITEPATFARLSDGRHLMRIRPHGPDGLSEGALR